MRQNGVDYAWGISRVNYDEAFRDIIRDVLRVASGYGSPDCGRISECHPVTALELEQLTRLFG